MEAIVIIPARYGSTRLEGKLLLRIDDKPIIRYVYERAVLSRLAGRVLVAADDERIYSAVKSFGGEVIMTSKDHESGTDRVAEAVGIVRGMGDTSFDIVVNLQGDEPLIRPEMIDDLISLMDDARAEIGTLKREITDMGDVDNPNCVKVVTDNEGFALYFSRSPIPFYRDAIGGRQYYKHVGIYGFRCDSLFRLTSLPQGGLEKIERLEQLRALENGMKIKVRETGYDTIGVDTLDDFKRVEACLNIYS